MFMLISTTELLNTARRKGYAVGAFNVYNLEGVRAVVAAAEAQRSPAMLQILPSALRHGGPPLVTLCLTAARDASVPMGVHLDHSTSADDIRAALDAGLNSVMADGSHLPYTENVAFTRDIAELVHARGGAVEAELGRLTGTEDNLTIPDYEEKLTSPGQAADFIAETGIDALAVCIGNVHGRYPGQPRLDFERLDAIHRTVSVPLVLHGASGLPEDMVRRSIELGITKFNVNTEVRAAYIGALQERVKAAGSPDLLDLMQSAIAAMQPVVEAKLQLFGSAGQA
ncbi:MAG: class II fructose-bisphosphate aldolase family protein [Anaerolineae bacterium]